MRVQPTVKTDGLFSVVPVGLQAAGAVNCRAFMYFIIFLHNFTRLMYGEVQLELMQPKAAGNGSRLKVKR